MTSDFLRRAAAAVTLLLVGGCASPPVHFYSLVGPTAVGSPALAASFAIALDRVSVPSQVNIPQLVVGSSGGGSLRLAEDRRWLAPLDQEIGAALSQHLQARLGVADVSRVSAPATVKVYRVRVDVQRFESVPGGEAQVAALWSVRDAGSATVTASCMTRVSESAAADYDALVDAYRRAVAVIAAQIADGIGQVARNAASFSCPAVIGQQPAPPT